jgi:hypothetical protein
MADNEESLDALLRKFDQARPKPPVRPTVASSPAPQALPSEPTLEEEPIVVTESVSQAPEFIPYGTPERSSDPTEETMVNPYGSSYDGSTYPPQGLPAHPNGVKLFLLALLSFMCCQLLSPVAWFLTSKAKKEIKAGGYGNTPLLTAGMILAILGTIILIITPILYLFLGLSFTTTYEQIK